MSADYFAYVREGKPICLRTVRRAYHDTDDAVAPALRDATLESREFCDGFGRVIQTRVQAEEILFGAAGDAVGLSPVPGAATGAAVGVADGDRVVVSAWTIFDNKGQPVRVFEPFFDNGWAYQPDAARGHVTTTHYDGLGRAVRTVRPDGAEARTVHGIPTDPAILDEYEPTPWETYLYDANDLAALSFGPDGSTLAGGAPAAHHATPSSIIADSGGRVICRIVRNGPNPATDWQVTRARYDAENNLIRLIDPVGREALRAVYNLAGNALRVDSDDAGVRITVRNADSNPIEFRDGTGRMALRSYDAGGRLVRCWARDSAAAQLTLRERISYGDEGDHVANRALNRLGEPDRKI